MLAAARFLPPASVTAPTHGAACRIWDFLADTNVDEMELKDTERGGMGSKHSQDWGREVGLFSAGFQVAIISVCGRQILPPPLFLRSSIVTPTLFRPGSQSLPRPCAHARQLESLVAAFFGSRQTRAQTHSVPVLDILLSDSRFCLRRASTLETDAPWV